MYRRNCVVLCTFAAFVAVAFTGQLRFFLHLHKRLGRVFQRAKIADSGVLTSLERAVIDVQASRGTRLSLAGVDLSAVPLYPLQKLKDALQELDLSRCKLSSSRLDLHVLYTLTNLRKLNLMSNELESLPEGIRQLEQLELLGLKSNRLRRLPNDLGGLRRLVALFLTDNSLLELPESIGNLKSLRKLQASNNQLQSLPETMRQLDQLELLRVPVNHIGGGVGLRAISAPKLKWLSFASNPAFLTPEAATAALNALPIATADELVYEQDGNLSNADFGGASGGDVLRAVYRGERVAVKLFADAQGDQHISPDGAAQDEMALVALLGEHPNLPHALARVGTSRKGLVLRLEKGRPLARKPVDSISVLRCRYGADETFTELFTFRVALSVASAVKHMHSKRIAHGDIYAHNVLVSDTGAAVLIDLGAAFAYHDDAAKAVEAAEARAIALLVEELSMRVPHDDRGRLYKAMVDAISHLTESGSSGVDALYSGLAAAAAAVPGGADG
eukprot:NODE_1050_length_1740_cov_26.256653_g927_i0.p1 GENE.NODE_1050_length_1740_cov_26.256653_g927_i0~~NODE_1050_length_1740_cov_26.256653_g927_i0.p1  ORF type:complete len:503 (-),score=96.95 NODE_1050_length_1740_cov_26.256653_g927_i0:132-1640(-)